MKLKGIYTVKQNNGVLAKSKNQIQTDGFRLVQNWFSSTEQTNIKLIDVDDQNHSVEILSNEIQSQNLVNINGSIDIRQLFLGYTGKYCYTKSKNSYLRVIFREKRQIQNSTDFQYVLQKRKISAIGIDIAIIATGDNYESLLMKNSNIQLRYSDNIQLQNLPLNDRSDVVVPVSIKNTSFVKNDVGYQQKMFYLKQPTDITQLKITFNTFCDDYLKYTIYAINLYQEKQVIKPPTHMTLYDINDNVVFHKQIEISYPNQANGYSVLFQTTLPYDQLDSTMQIKAISTDYYQNGQVKQFSYSQYEQSWSQQQLTNIQLQYQLFFSNDSSPISE